MSGYSGKSVRPSEAFPRCSRPRPWLRERRRWHRTGVRTTLRWRVRSELVSEGYFPASWENTGKFIDSGLSHPNFQSKALVDQRLTVRIPCEMEQGNNCALAGN